VTVKDQLHRLVEELPDSELPIARRFLEYLRIMGRDPLLRALIEAPIDDEPASAEEDREAEEAWNEYRRGEARPWEEVRQELVDE